MKPVRELGRRGEPTIRIDDRYLHSPYSPRTEALRFLDHADIPHDTRTLLVIGDGLGLIAGELSERRPEIRVLSIEPADTPETLELFYHGSTRDRLPGGAMDARSIRQTLRESLHPTDIGGVQLLVWPGIDKCSPDWRDTVERGVRDALRDLRSELATIAQFGRLWISNGIRATIKTDRRSEVTIRGDRLYLAASGPTVSALPDGVRPIAVSSALHALRYRGIAPLLVLHTDAGPWGRRYLHDCADLAGSIPVLPLRAGPVRTEAPILLADRSLVDQLAPDAASWPGLPDQPSVGASLIDLALRLGGASELICAGLDLCSYDLIQHGRPHRNDRYIAARASRLVSDTTQRYVRILPEDRSVRWDDGTLGYVSDALEAFATPIRSLLEAGGDQVIRPLVASPVWRGFSMPAGRDPTSYGTGVAPRLDRREIERPPLHARRRHVEATVSAWRDRIDSGDHADRDRRDLLLYLAPVEYLADQRDGSNTSVVAARDALRRIAAKALPV